MAIILRVIGGLWAFLSFKTVWGVLREIVLKGISFHFGLSELIGLTMFAGGVGLLLLKEWGRWVLLLGAGAFLISHLGPAVLEFKFNSSLLKNAIFYGVFVALLLLPQSKAATS